MRIAGRVGVALVLGIVALVSLSTGYAAAEELEGRKLFGVLEGDWFFLFGFIGAAACLWAAVRLLRTRS